MRINLGMIRCVNYVNLYTISLNIMLKSSKVYYIGLTQDKAEKLTIKQKAVTVMG